MIVNMVGKAGCYNITTEEHGIWRWAQSHHGGSRQSLNCLWVDKLNRKTRIRTWSAMRSKAFLTMIKRCLELYPSRRKKMDSDLLKNRFFFLDDDEMKAVMEIAEEKDPLGVTYNDVLTWRQG